MATTYQLKSYAEPAWDVKNCTIERISKPEDVTGTKFETVNNVFQAFKLPVGAKILGGGILCEDLDDATDLTLRLRVTNGTTTKNFGSAASAVGQTGGIVLYPVAGTSPIDPSSDPIGFVTDDQDYRVEILVAAAAGAAAGNTADLRAFIKYTMDTESGERTF